MAVDQGYSYVLRRIPDGEPDPPYTRTIEGEFTELNDAFVHANGQVPLCYEPDGKGGARFVYEPPASKLNLQI